MIETREIDNFGNDKDLNALLKNIQPKAFIKEDPDVLNVLKE